MLRKTMKALLACVAASHASVALALIDAQVLVGKRWYKWETSGNTKGVASTAYTLAAHLDPIPLIPVSFGLSATMSDLQSGDVGAGVSKATLAEAGLDFMAWVPFFPVITPYGRLTLPLHSRMTVSGKAAAAGSTTLGDLDAIYKLSGFHLNFGAKVSIAPLVKVLVEAGRGFQKIETEEYKIGGEKVSGMNSKNDINSNTVLAGIEVGF